MRPVPLYKGAEKKSYYKYYQEIETIPEKEIKRIQSLKGDPDIAPPFSKRAVIQTEQYEPVPEGVYIMKDGTLFISALTETPDLTGEMAEWWMIWHQMDPLRYALWNPEDHFDVQISEPDRSRFTDENLPVRERIWGTTSYISESWNGGNPQKGELHFVSPDTIGLRNDLIGTPKCKAIVCASNSVRIGPFSYPVTMCEQLRENTEGVNEWVVSAWMGHGIKDGQEISFVLPKFILKRLSSAMPSLFIAHNHKEISHLNRILPSLYSENKSNWFE